MNLVQNWKIKKILLQIHKNNNNNNKNYKNKNKINN